MNSAIPFVPRAEIGVAVLMVLGPKIAVLVDSQERMSLMLDRSPKRFVSFLLRYRYPALMVAVNMPGNIVIGGGGGIALMAGLSRLFSPSVFVFTVAIAISPVPLAWLVFGENFAEWPL